MPPDPAVVWGAGDYPDIGRTIAGVSGVVVEAAGVRKGDVVLDVATGSGNCAIEAARRGAQVTGVDIVPALLEVAAERAESEGLRIDLVEGDAGALPCDDARFDRVTSVFGAMFAPDHERTAAELVRACKPGGTIAVTAWTPAGLNGTVFPVLGKYGPPPPEGFQPPILWGNEDHVRRLFDGAGTVECSTLNATDSVRGESPEAFVDYLSRTLGPFALARTALEDDGRWETAKAEIVEVYKSFNEADDGTMLAHPEYLLTVVTKAG